MPTQERKLRARRKLSVSFSGYKPSSSAASRRMRLNTASGGRAERVLGAELRRQGLRVEVQVGDLPGKPDIVIRSARVCVFCDGDFWHGRNWPRLSRQLKERANADYWIEKIDTNRRRDRLQTRKLRAAGWTVIRVWEGDVLERPETTARRIVRYARPQN